MKTKTLGKTGLEVSILGIGTLTMSPMQRGLSTQEGAKVILAAFEQGIRFVDTAQTYGSYPQVACALTQWKGPRPIVASKSPAATAQDMETAIHEARQALNLDSIDLFLMHAVKNDQDIEHRKPALEVLLKAKAKGFIKAIGASSHSVPTIELLSRMNEIDVLHPIMNRDGLGIIGSTRDVLLDILAKAKAAGKGIYAMKPLGGGHLRNDAANALSWIFTRVEIDCAAVGMTSVEEVLMNVAVAKGEIVTEELQGKAKQQPRKPFINKVLCVGCGKCLETCDHGAIDLIEGKAQVNETRCILCGYCAPKCPSFAIRVI